MDKKTEGQVYKYYSGTKEFSDSDIRSFSMLGKINLWNGNLKEAYDYFNKIQSIFGCAYCKFLNCETGEAKILLNLVKDSSSAVNWLLFLISIIEDNISENPTYFQIRNFYEQDLEMIFRYKKIEYAQKIIVSNPYLENFNKEIYKYSARVLYNNNYLTEAEKLLKKSLDIFFNDPETHFMLGEIYLKNKEILKAKSEYKKAVEVTGEYFPAKNKLLTIR